MIIKYCPIISFQKPYHEETTCIDGCAFADDSGECLIRQALMCYIDNSCRKEEYELLHKDGRCIPINFEDTLEAYKRTPLYPQPIFQPPTEIK